MIYNHRIVSAAVVSDGGMRIGPGDGIYFWATIVYIRLVMIGASLRGGNAP